MDAAIVVAAISGAVAAGSMVMTYRASSKATDVSADANQIQWAKELRADAADARRESREARTEAEGANLQARVARGQLREIVSYLGWVLRTIHAPGMTLERLRETVPPDLPPLPDRNGRPEL